MSQTPVKFPAALPAPTGPLNIICESQVRAALEASRQSPRRRIIFPFHKNHGDNLHRMFNVVQPGTYIRPHRHVSVPKAEAIIVLRGAIHFFEFAEDGAVRSHCRLAAGFGNFGVDIESGIIHTFITVETDTVLFEVKPGPYAAITDKDFAAWAPAEGAPEAAAYLERLAQLAKA